ncbi:hypothetical protein TNCV_1371831 [Trichonephila clavipes]|nr:hypothetical protein TNCV_1371831 [Trichonephila clavipes]
MYSRESRERQLHSRDFRTFPGMVKPGKSETLIEAMQALQDAGKNGWKMADFSVMMVADDLGPQQIGRTDRLSDQLSQRLIHRYQPSDVLHAHEYPP